MIHTLVCSFNGTRINRSTSLFVVESLMAASPLGAHNTIPERGGIKKLGGTFKMANSPLLSKDHETKPERSRMIHAANSSHPK
jgi:hypothetical protein